MQYSDLHQALKTVSTKGTFMSDAIFRPTPGLKDSVNRIFGPTPGLKRETVSTEYSGLHQALKGRQCQQNIQTYIRP